MDIDTALKDTLTIVDRNIPVSTAYSPREVEIRLATRAAVIPVILREIMARKAADEPGAGTGQHCASCDGHACPDVG